MTGSSSHHDPSNDPGSAEAGIRGPAPTLTPASLGEQRVEAPTLGEQLSEYEERQRVLESQLEEIDPMAAQGVYLLVAVVAGVTLASLVAGVLGGLAWAGGLL